MNETLRDSEKLFRPFFLQYQSLGKSFGCTGMPSCVAQHPLCLSTFQYVLPNLQNKTRPNLLFLRRRRQQQSTRIIPFPTPQRPIRLQTNPCGSTHDHPTYPKRPHPSQYPQHPIQKTQKITYPSCILFTTHQCTNMDRYFMFSHPYSHHKLHSFHGRWVYSSLMAFICHRHLRKKRGQSRFPSLSLRPRPKIQTRTLHVFFCPFQRVTPKKRTTDDRHAPSRRSLWYGAILPFNGYICKPFIMRTRYLRRDTYEILNNWIYGIFP